MNNLRPLEFALALDQHRNFGRAAEAMGVTQPSFSRAIAALEAQLGARLFDRSNRGVEPTPSGVALLSRARRLLADAASLPEALDDYRNLRSGSVAIGVGPYALDLSVIECVVRLASQHPLLQIELVEGRWHDFGARLLSGEVEVAVMEIGPLAQDARFRVEALPPHQGCFYCRSGHPLTRRTGLTLAEIIAYPLVGVRIALRAVTAGKLNPRLLPLDPVSGNLVPRIATSSIAAARSIIKRTDGIGIAAPEQLADDLRRAELAILDADAGALKSAYGIAYLDGRTLSPGAAAFVGVLKDVEAEMAAKAEAGPASGGTGAVERRPPRR
jgi:DNA-binding transcriptional LysR family regulator